MFVTVTGGSGSGKSAFAEEQILKFPEKNRLYIATMVCFDEESRQHLKEQAADVCVVTNEIFSDGMVYDKETENYQRLLGRINAYLAEISDVCYEVVYGIPLRIK